MRGTQTFCKYKKRLFLFFSTFYEIFKGVLKDGRVFAGFRVKKRRLETCESCPYFLKEHRVCDECGCFMDIKTGFLNADCPKGYWDKV